MNKERRNRIKEIIKMIDDVKNHMDNISSLIDDVMSDEQEAFDNMPEGLQYSERGYMMESYIESLQCACDAINELEFDSVVDQLESCL